MSDSNWRTFLANARKNLDVGALLLACGLIDGSENTAVCNPMQSGPQEKRPREEHRGAGGSGGIEKEKISCRYLLQFGNCKNPRCPFEHDESAMPNSKRQKSVPEKEKEKGNSSKKKKYEFKMGSCTHCWMPKDNPDFKSSHGNGDKYGKEACPYGAEPIGCKKEKNEKNQQALLRSAP